MKFLRYKVCRLLRKPRLDHPIPKEYLKEVKNILMETAGLDPSTTIRVDKTSKSIIVDAPPWDHMVVEKLATKLDGSARQFRVIQLRRLSAVQVATTVEAMMGEPEEENNRNRYSYFSYRYGQQEDKKPKTIAVR